MLNVKYVLGCGYISEGNKSLDPHADYILLTRPEW